MRRHQYLAPVAWYLVKTAWTKLGRRQKSQQVGRPGIVSLSGERGIADLAGEVGG